MHGVNATGMRTGAPYRFQRSIEILKYVEGTLKAPPTNIVCMVKNPGGPLQCTIALGYVLAPTVAEMSCFGLKADGTVDTGTEPDISNSLVTLRAVQKIEDKNGKLLRLQNLVADQALPISWAIDDEVDYIMVDVSATIPTANAAYGSFYVVASWAVKTDFLCAMGKEEIDALFAQTDLSGPGQPFTTSNGQ